MNTKLILATLALLVMFVLFVLAGGDNHHEMQHQMYCDMVELYKQTNGEAGWPAYQGTKYCPTK